MCPSISRKNRYSHALVFIGLDSIFARFMLCLEKGSSILYRAPASSLTANITDVLSEPLLSELFFAYDQESGKVVDVVLYPLFDYLQVVDACGKFAGYGC